MAGWTSEQIETLQRLWKEGHSATMIGRQVGKSRNAVLGKAWREDMRGRENVTTRLYPKAIRRKPVKISARKTFWTDIRLWQLNKWNEEGLTSVEIAAKFNNAVSDAAVRMKLGRKCKRSRGRPRSTAVRNIPETQHPNEMECVPFLDVRANQCRFPLWAPEHKIGDCCGNKINPGNPYCEHHMAIAYKPGTAINQQPRKVA